MDDIINPLLIMLFMFQLVILVLHGAAFNRRINYVLSNWSPNRVFYKELTNADDTYKEYTCVGQWLKNVPGVISGPFLLVYYVPVCIGWCVCLVLDITWDVLTNPIFKE